MKTIAVFALMSLCFSACGAGDDEASCENVMTRYCNMACDCTEGAACGFYATDGQSESTIKFDSVDDCLTMFVGMACGGAQKPPADFLIACNSSLDTAQCVDADEIRALQVPDACNKTEN